MGFAKKKCARERSSTLRVNLQTTGILPACLAQIQCRQHTKHCFALGKRPTEFGSKEGSGVTYIVLKRVKK
jgi:hypothetical protein